VNDNVSSEEVNEVAADITSPGKFLCDLREQNNLSKEQVATKLHMDVNLIAALEADRYQDFPAPIFISGYLRNYAKLLDVDADPLVNAFRKTGIAEPQITSGHSTGGFKRKFRETDRWIGIVIIALTGSVLGYFLISPAPSEIADVTVINGHHESEVISDTEDVLVNTRRNIDDNALVSTVLSAPPDNEKIPTTTVQTPEKLISLRFTADSWVELTDAKQVRLFYDLGKAGQTLELWGIPPFRILLGYSPGVTIEYNGVGLDHSKYSRNDVARFRFGTSAN